MSDPIIGLVFRRRNEEPRPAIYADLSTAGFVGPMPDADPKVFPLNTPVKGYSNDPAFLKAMGAGGFIPDALRGLNDQLGLLQRSGQVIIVRTAPGQNADATLAYQQTIARVLGDRALSTGLWALTLAPELCAATPRLISTPGHTGILASIVGTITRTKAGKGYVEGVQYALTFSGGGANAVQAEGYAVGQSDGTLGDAVLTATGQWYASAPTIAAAAPPAGADVETATYTAAIDKLANPICAGITPVLNELLAHAVVESSGVSQQADEDWRETLNGERLIPISGGCKVTDPDTGAVVTRPLAPRMIGIMIRRDHETGAPFHSACNQPVYGILGPNRRIKTSILNLENEGQELLAANIGVLCPGELGNDFAIASGGYILLSTDNAGEDELWRFYNQTRGRDFMHLTLIRMMRFYLGKFNITYQTLTSIINGMKYVVRDLKASGNILGGRVTFTGTENSAEELRKGNIVIGFAAEEPAPLRKITTLSSRMRSAVDDLVMNLEAELNIAA